MNEQQPDVTDDVCGDIDWRARYERAARTADRLREHAERYRARAEKAEAELEQLRAQLGERQHAAAHRIGEMTAAAFAEQQPAAADRLQAWLDSTNAAPSRADVRSVLWDRAEHAAERARLRATIQRLKAELATPGGLTEEERHAAGEWIEGRRGATGACEAAPDPTTPPNARSTATGPQMAAASQWGADPAHGGHNDTTGQK